MKTFEQLTGSQQNAAVQHCLAELLTAILEGAIRFNDKANKDNLQRRIDAACARAEKMQTPWFAHEYILDTCREDLEALARPQAEDSVYLSEGENAIRLSALKSYAS